MVTPLVSTLLPKLQHSLGIQITSYPESHSLSSSIASCHMFPKRKTDTELKSQTERSGGVVAEPTLIPMTSLTPSTEVTLCHFLTDFDVTHFQESLVLYPVNHMTVPHTRVYRHPLGQSCDRSTCHGAHPYTSSHCVFVCVCVLKEEMYVGV